MGQIKVEKNVGGIEGLCVIEPAVHGDGAEADGVAVDVNSLVSMNMWGLTPDFLDVLEDGFKEFFKEEVPGNPLKAEYLIPIFIGEQLKKGNMSVKVLKTNDTWYGMTYHEDVADVKDSFKKMLEKGVYKTDLFSDLDNRKLIITAMTNMIKSKDNDWVAQNAKGKLNGNVMKSYVTLYLKAREERKLIAKYTQEINKVKLQNGQS